MRRNNPTIGRSGTQLDEVKTHVRVDENGPTGEGVPKNPYMDGGRIKREKNNYSGSKLRSHGFGPSKPQINEKLPELSLLEKKLITFVEKNGPVSPAALAQWAEKEGHLPELIGIMAGWVKDAEMATFARGGYVLMAEGRRIADLL